MFIRKKASVFIYILLLVNISLVMWILVYNNFFIINNNISVWTNIVDFFKAIWDKWDISINVVKKYNINWGWFVDNISCPTNITMSWATASWTNISTQITYSSWSIFCSWSYNSNNFKILFNSDFSAFEKAYYSYDIVNINEVSGSFSWDRAFNDLDSTLLTFTSDWISWDNYDDNFNSDDYKVFSTGSIYFPNNFEDDDVIPRKTIFWGINDFNKYYNIFWDNYKTEEFIQNNPNNIDNINIKIWDVENGNIYIDLYNNSWSTYNLKIIEFDKNSYQNLFTLLPLNVSEWLYLSNYSWYIQTNSWSLSLSKNITWNEYNFDFKNKDYGIFLANNWNSKFIYKITWKTSTWTWIYLNPVDDSSNISIKAMSTHISQSQDWNYMWEVFITVWLK